MAEEAYVVRGAKLRCDKGSHCRLINLPKSHGSYVDGKPIMAEDDCKFGTNIMSFGICQIPKGEEITLVGEDGKPVTGSPCVANILGKWQKTKTGFLADGSSALTTESYMICMQGGIITIVESGQEK